MDNHLETVELLAPDIKSLQVRVAQYACDAVGSIGDPGMKRIGVALDAAVAAGTPVTSASEGYIADRDA